MSSEILKLQKLETELQKEIIFVLVDLCWRKKCHAMNQLHYTHKRFMYGKQKYIQKVVKIVVQSDNRMVSMLEVRNSIRLASISGFIPNFHETITEREQEREADCEPQTNCKHCVLNQVNQTQNKKQKLN